MKLNSIVPWGRSFEEYQAIFSLSESDLSKSFLGCSDGPAAFNARLTEQGGKVTSVDPTYCFSAEQFKSRIAEVYDEVMHQVALNKHDFVWRNIPSIEALGKTRMASMNTFLHDYELGKLQGRYIEGALPSLPFEDKHFDIALCSHFLFLYSEQVSLEAHIEGLVELCRVAQEVRVYPLVTLTGEVSPHLEPVMKTLMERGYSLALAASAYEFQKGATEMLVLSY